MKVAELGKLDRVLVVGAFLRKDQPLLATASGRRRNAAEDQRDPRRDDDLAMTDATTRW